MYTRAAGAWWRVGTVPPVGNRLAHLKICRISYSFPNYPVLPIHRLARLEFHITSSSSFPYCPSIAPPPPASAPPVQCRCLVLASCQLPVGRGGGASHKGVGVIKVKLQKVQAIVSGLFLALARPPEELRLHFQLSLLHTARPFDLPALLDSTTRVASLI